MAGVYAKLAIVASAKKTPIAPTWSRTKNLLIKSQMLYQLSYRGVAAGILLSAVASFKRPGRLQKFDAANDRKLSAQLSQFRVQIDCTDAFREFRAVRVQ